MDTTLNITPNITGTVAYFVIVRLVNQYFVSLFLELLAPTGIIFPYFVLIDLGYFTRALLKSQQYNGHLEIIICCSAGVDL
jgi:hypothetical protein